MFETEVGLGLERGWAAQEVQGALLRDERFRRVMIEILEARASQIGVSFSSMCGNPLRQAAGRLLRHEDTEPNDLLLGHRQATLNRCLSERTIVVAQDSSSYNYSTHTATTGLGPINDSKTAAGIHQHSALAMTPDKFPLGVVDAHFWARSAEKLTAAQRRKKPIEDKESYRWLRTTKQIEELFAPYLHQGGQVVVVADREADIFELLAQERSAGLELIIRAAQPRRVEVRGSGSLCSLWEAADQGEGMGEYTLLVSGRTKAQDREATMGLRCSCVKIQPPQGGVGHSKEAIAVRIVHAQEVLPEGSKSKALEWTMITTLEVTDMATARRVLDLYTCRWEIERLHYTLKSGCQAEHLQMDDLDTLCNTLALYLIVAWRLLYVTHLGRVAPETCVEQILAPAEVSVLNQKNRDPILTVSQAIVAIAKLGGFEPYKGGPLPGVKVIWIGLRKLESMAVGWQLAMDSIRTQNVIQA